MSKAAAQLLIDQMDDLNSKLAVQQAARDTDAQETVALKMQIRKLEQQLDDVKDNLSVTTEKLQEEKRKRFEAAQELIELKNRCLAQDSALEIAREKLDINTGKSLLKKGESSAVEKAFNSTKSKNLELMKEISELKNDVLYYKKENMRLQRELKISNEKPNQKAKLLTVDFTASC
eukprot:Platyproteum_vivax@DN4500_c0_g1_i1.p1